MTTLTPRTTGRRRRWLPALAALLVVAAVGVPALIPAAVATGDTAAAAVDRPVTACRVPNTLGDLGEGFPIHSQAVRAQGSVRAALLFVDFSDRPAPAGSLAAARDNLIPAVAMLNQMSAGRMTISTRIDTAWVRMPRPTTGYPWSQSHSTYIRDAITAADPTFDFSGIDVVWITATRAATSISNSPTSNHQNITVDGTTIRNAITFGHDQWSWGPKVLAHEMGHTLGLPDLYQYGAADPFGATGGFDLMGLISGRSPEFLAWHRWLLGWLSNSAVRCLGPGESRVRLVAGEWGTGATMAAVPLGGSRVLVLESRRPLRYDRDQAGSGVLVYVIDAAVRGGQGPVQVMDTRPATATLDDALLSEGSWTHDASGVQVTWVSGTGAGDVVQVTVPAV